MNPLPQGRSIYALWIAPDGETTFAGGLESMILRHRPGTAATAWERVPTPTSISAVNGLWGSSVGDVWAVGDGGTILHLEGNGFVRVDSGTTRTLAAVWGASPDDIWAVGSEEQIFLWDGTRWTRVVHGIGGELLEKVRGSSAEDVWAVGAGTYGEQLGASYHFDGQTWTRQVPEGSSKFHALSDLSAAGAGWAVAHRYDRPLSTIWRLAGGAWTPFDQTVDGKPVAMAGRPGGTVWAGGYAGLLLHWQTDRFVDPWGPHPRDHLNAAWAAGPADAWAVGYGGAILRWDGVSWKRVSRGVFPDLFGVHGSDANNVFFVGAEGAVLRWDGREIRRVPTDFTATLRVVSVRPNDVWFGGGSSGSGAVWRWDGQNVIPQLSRNPLGLWRAAAEELWVLSGATISRWNGVEWSHTAAPGYVVDM